MNEPSSSPQSPTQSTTPLRSLQELQWVLAQILMLLRRLPAA
ncbi:MAG TPA: hypothetical protein VE244_05510 [Nitrososphaeraceae archaeon]|nr:hypothetical protein [Nitrososphaeraceae archaeon]